MQIQLRPGTSRLVSTYQLPPLVLEACWCEASTSCTSCYPSTSSTFMRTNLLLCLTFFNLLCSYASTSFTRTCIWCCASTSHTCTCAHVNPPLIMFSRSSTLPLVATLQHSVPFMKLMKLIETKMKGLKGKDRVKERAWNKKNGLRPKDRAGTKKGSLKT